jgi:hypothetical protein
VQHWKYSPDESQGLVFWLPQDQLWRIIDVYLKHSQYPHELFESEKNGWTLLVHCGRDLDLVRAGAVRALAQQLD